MYDEYLKLLLYSNIDKDSVFYGYLRYLQRLGKTVSKIKMSLYTVYILRLKNFWMFQLSWGLTEIFGIII